MRSRFLVLGAILSLPVAAQVQTVAAKTKGAPAAKSWTAARTPDGQPDIQGIWSNSTLTPLERPKDLAGKEFLTEQEAAAREKRLLEELSTDRRDGGAEADVGLQAPVEDRRGQGAALAEKRDVAGASDVLPERGIEPGVRIHDTEAIGA